MKYKFFLSILSVILTTQVHAQMSTDDPSQVTAIPTSPTMWEFEKYGNYPVSMHTGVPNISIPIATAKSGMLEVPVSLSYHASGIKVDQKATWVGLGWSLMAGGAITRTIKGSADEYLNGYITYPFKAQGTIDPDKDYSMIESMMIGQYDTEPDVFSYNFLGYSGNFIFNRSSSLSTATVALIPHQDLKVKATFNSGIASFTITTPEGITAEFEFPELMSQYRQSLAGSLTVAAPTVWHLKKLTAPNGIDEISFEYNLVNGFGYPSILGRVSDERTGKSEGISYPNPCNSSNNNLYTSIITPSVSYTNVKKLHKIIFNNGYILFNTSNGNRLDDPSDEESRLDKIEIYATVNSNDKLIKSFELDYSYFGTYSSSEYEVRLKLDKVTEKGSSGGANNPYEFDYNEGETTFNTLPNRFTNGQDFWGYYNGKNANASLVPQISYMKRDGVTINLGSANRDIDSRYTQAGMLNKITFPTKGYTLFEFENNSATLGQPSPGQHLTGGLRVKHIKSYNNDNDLEWEKQYEYTQKNDANKSSGVYNASEIVDDLDYFSSRTSYATITNNYNFNCYQNGIIDIATHSDKISESPNMANNFASTFYGEVKVYNGSSTNHNGYTWYEYTATKDDLYQGTGPLSVLVDRSWDRGQLLSEETYKNGSSTAVSYVVNNYENISIQSDITAYKAGSRFDVPSIGYLPSVLQGVPNGWRNNQYFFVYYAIPISWKRLKSTTRVQDGVSNTQNFYYNSTNAHTNIVKTTTAGSDGLALEFKTYFPEDIIDTSFPVLEGGQLSSITEINKLKKDVLHRINVPIQTVSKNDGKVTSIRRTLFKTDDGISVPSKIQTSFSSAMVSDEILFNAYEDGKLIDVSKANGSHTIYIWGYQGQYPIAKIENASYSQVSGFVSNLQTLSDSEDTESEEAALRQALKELRNAPSLSKAMITTYTYDPLVGVTSITDPKGYTMYYEYDAFNRLEYIKDADGHIINKNEYHYKNQ